MDKALTVKEAANMLQVHPMTVYRLVNGGRLRSFRTGVQNHGGGIRIWPKDLKEFSEDDHPAPDTLEEVSA